MWGSDGVFDVLTNQEVHVHGLRFLFLFLKNCGCCRLLKLLSQFYLNVERLQTRCACLSSWMYLWYFCNLFWLLLPGCKGEPGEMGKKNIWRMRWRPHMCHRSLEQLQRPRLNWLGPFLTEIARLVWGHWPLYYTAFEFNLQRKPIDTGLIARSDD